MITVHRGQAISWPESPTGLAQVDDVLRRNVVIGWTQNNRWRTRRVPASAVAVAASQQLLFTIHNPFDRACRPKAKTFNV